MKIVCHRIVDFALKSLEKLTTPPDPIPRQAPDSSTPVGPYASSSIDAGKAGREEDGMERLLVYSSGTELIPDNFYFGIRLFSSSRLVLQMFLKVSRPSLADGPGGEETDLN